MFIREVKKQHGKNSKIFYQYNLVQASRIDGKVKQRVILYLGSSPLLQDKDNRNTVLQILKSKIFKQPALFPPQASPDIKNIADSLYRKYLVKFGETSENQASIPPDPKKSEFHNIDLKGIEVADVRSFGAEHLCKQVIDKLQFKQCFSALGMSSEEINKALTAIAARAIFASSEHKTAQILDLNSELATLYKIKKPLTHKQLYRVSDKLYKYKDTIDAFLYKRVANLFDLNDKLVIFDISNSYFETGKSGSRLAKYAKSKEKRDDCPVVVFTGVINMHGFIRHSRIYEGNKPDTSTLPDMIADLEQHSQTSSKKTIVIDAGIATEDNLAFIREKQYDYVCVSRKRLKDYPVNTADKLITKKTDRGKQEVELSVFRPDGYPDTWMYVQSESKRKKEQSMSRKLSQRFEEELENINASLSKKGGTKKTEKVWERIGRAKQKHRNVSGRYKILDKQEDGKITELTWEKIEDPVKTDKEKGVYFIRTSYKNPAENELWDIYNTIREVEATFRCLKSDLQIRPVYHQKDTRIESHIYLTILAYQLVNTIRYMLRQNNMHHDWSNILRVMSTQTIQNIELPTETKTIHIRKPAKPIHEVNEIYKATNCNETQKTIRKYVVYH